MIFLVIIDYLLCLVNILFLNFFIGLKVNICFCNRYDICKLFFVKFLNVLVIFKWFWICVFFWILVNMCGIYIYIYI